MLVVSIDPNAFLCGSERELMGKSRMLAEGSIGCAKNSTMVYESSSSKLSS